MFRGLIAYTVTPMDPEGRVRTEDLGRLVDRLAGTGLDRIGLLGSTGCFAFLSRAQRRRAVEAAAEAVAGRVPLTVGIGAIRADEVEALARDAAEAGAAGLLLPPVSYLPLTEAEVFGLYARASAATDLPLCIYENPTNTRFSFTPEMLGRLAGLPNIVAVKTPAPGPGERDAKLSALRTALPEAFALGVSGDWNAPGALLAGADGWHSVVAGLLPEPALALARVAMGGHSAPTARINTMFQPLWSLFQEFGSLRVVYPALGLLGICDLAPPAPLLPMPASAMERLESALARIEAWK